MNEEFGENLPPLTIDEGYVLNTLSRSTEMRNNNKGLVLNGEDGDDELPDEWYNDQCGQCRYFWLVLEHPLDKDYGLCTNAASQFDRQVMFEHDGCEHYLGASAWISEFVP